MQRRRSYRKPKRPTNRVIQAGNVVLAAGAQGVGYLFTATDPCTATKFRLDTGLTAGVSGPMAYALVYVPSGYSINNLTYPTVPPANMYEPAMQVLVSGVLTDNATEDHKSSRYGRRMASGDRVALIYLNATGQNHTASFELNFTTVH